MFLTRAGGLVRVFPGGCSSLTNVYKPRRSQPSSNADRSGSGGTRLRLHAKILDKTLGGSLCTPQTGGCRGRSEASGIG